MSYDFDPHNVSAIDPPNCGCLECEIGEYVPLNHSNIAEVFKAIVEDGAEIRNNLNYGTMIVYRTGNGTYDYVTNSTMLGSSDIEVFKPFDDSISSLEEFEEEQPLTDALVDDDEKAEDVFNHPDKYRNQTGELVIAYRSRYGEYGFVKIPATDEEYAILWYYD